MQHEPTYRQTLRHAWRLTWHNKSLWGLGLLAALFAGSFGINNFLGQLITSMSNQGEVVIFYMPNFNYLPGSIPTGYFALSILSLVMLAILVAIIYISIVSKTALLNAMAEYYKKKYAPRLGKIWNKSLDYFWQIFTIEVGRKIAFFLLLFIFGLVWVNLASTESAWGIIFTSLLLLITLVIALVIASISIFASGYVVIDNQPVKESLKNAYKLFKRHFLVCLEVSLLLLFIDFLLLFVIAGIISLFFLPATALSLVAAATSSPLLLVFGIIFTLVLLIAVIIIIGAVYNTFYTGTWMYLFMEMHHAGILSRVRDFFKRFFK